MEVNYSNLMQWLDQNTPLVASIAGACTSAYFTDVKTWREKGVCVILGAVTSKFLSKPIFDFLPQLGWETTCFLTGFFGLNVCAAILKSIRRFGDDADFWTLFHNFVMTKFSSSNDNDSKKG